METQKIGSRNYVFKYHLPDWDLNLHTILGEKNNYVIDTGLGAGSVAPIKTLLAGSTKPTIVINTHYHWDHVWGNHCFKKCTILSHTLCRQMMAENWAEMLEKHGQLASGAVEYCLPNLVFGSELSFPEDGIRVLYTPGHTVDSISVFDEVDRILDAGDNIGDTMEEIVPALSTEKSTYVDTLHKYMRLGAGTCICGHNALLKPDVFGKILNALGEARPG